MGWINNAKKQIAEESAVEAYEAGQLVYMHRIKLAMTQGTLSGPLAGFAEQIEAIEAAGWRMDQMSFSGESGYFLFRRSGNASTAG